MTVEKTMSDQRAKELQIVECCRFWLDGPGLRSGGLDAFGRALRKNEKMDMHAKTAGLLECVACGLITSREASEIL